MTLSEKVLVEVHLEEDLVLVRSARKRLPFFSAQFFSELN